VGKEKMRKSGYLSYTYDIIGCLLPLSVLCIALAGCADDVPSRYVGSLTPLAGTCDTAARTLLVRHASSVEFVPQDGVLILRGTLNAAGDIEATQDMRGATQGPYRLTFTGKLAADQITGTYVTPRCRYRVTLAPVSG